MFQNHKSLFPRALGVLSLGLLLFASACGRTRATVRVVHPKEHAVTLEVEVYDPVTNYVWEDVGVRIVEANVESTGCICANPDREDWYYTDEYGVVVFDPKALADADVGFEIDAFGQAILRAHHTADEATILIEVWAKGYKPVLWEVDVTWDDHEVLVQVPFGEVVN